MGMWAGVTSQGEVSSHTSGDWKNGVQEDSAFNKCCITKFIECLYHLPIGARKAKESLQPQPATVVQFRLKATRPLPTQAPTINFVPSSDQHTFADRELPLVKEKKVCEI